jgi:XTP/dITP diphosphohydrolase
MARQFEDDKIVVASHNLGKVREISGLLRPYGIKVLVAAELGLEEPEETGATFLENATLKARASAEASGLPALADDSGLVVPALGGAPGVHSARWAGPERDFNLAMERLVKELGDGDRSTHFVCSLALAWPDGHMESFEGKVFGTLVWPMRGDRGFGYDPIFLSKGERQTFGEMEPANKHKISHRAEAFRKLVAACFKTRR